MHPIVTVLHVGERVLPLGSFGVLLCLGIAVAALGTLRAAHAAGLDVGASIAALGIAAASGFGGAAALHALVQCIRFGTPLAALQPPGLAFFGAALGAAAGLSLCARWLGLPVLELADRAVPALAAGHAVGRIGCLLGGCCFGAPGGGPLALTYTHPLAPAAALGLARHPLPLYEAAGLLVLACAFALRRPRAPGSGERVLAYAAGYAVLRFALEFLRGDDVRGVFFGGVLSTSQLIAAGVLGWTAWRTLRAQRRVPA